MRIGVWPIPSTYYSLDTWSAPFWPFHRATVKKGVTFRTATPTNSLLWDITLDMGADGVISVVCQRKAPVPGKRQVFSLNGCVHQLSFHFGFISVVEILTNAISNKAHWLCSVHLWSLTQRSARAKANIAAFLEDSAYADHLQVVSRCSGKVASYNLLKSYIRSLIHNLLPINGCVGVILKCGVYFILTLAC